MNDYEITEHCINSTAKYLQIFQTENADIEYAVDMLKYLKSSFSKLALANKDMLDKIHLFIVRLNLNIPSLFRSIHTAGTEKIPTKQEAECAPLNTIYLWGLHQS